MGSQENWARRVRIHTNSSLCLIKILSTVQLQVNLIQVLVELQTILTINLIQSVYFWDFYECNNGNIIDIFRQKLNVDIYLAALIVFVGRIFNNIE